MLRVKVQLWKQARRIWIPLLSRQMSCVCALQDRLALRYLRHIQGPPYAVPLFKWSVFVSDEIATDGDGNIDSGRFAGQIKGEQQELRGLMLSPCHSEAHSSEHWPYCSKAQHMH